MTTATQPAQYGLHFARTIQQRFEAFDSEHPEIFDILASTCFELRAMGIKRYDIRGIWERLRWKVEVERRCGEKYKLCDHFSSRYARALIARYPELRDFFETRELRAE